MTQILLDIEPSLVAAASALIIALLAAATRWVHVHTTNKLVTSIVDNANADIYTFVTAQAQIVDKARGADGKLDATEAAAAKAAVIANLKKMWGEDGVKELMKVLGLDDSAFGLWLEAQIEAAVRNTSK